MNVRGFAVCRFLRAAMHARISKLCAEFDKVGDCAKAWDDVIMSMRIVQRLLR